MSQLKNYIEKELARGFSKKLIKEKLVKAGYRKEVLDETFAVIEGKKEILARKPSEMPHVEHARRRYWVFGLLAIVVIIALAWLLVMYMQPAVFEEEEPEPIIREVVEEERRSNCSYEDDQCFYYWALDTQDTEYCWKTTDAVQCQIDVALALGNVDLCDSDGCFAGLAIERNMPELCERVEERNKDRCYSVYSISFNDKSYCPEGYFACEFVLAEEGEKELMIQELIVETGPDDINSELISSATSLGEPLFCDYLEGSTPSFPEISYRDYCLMMTVYFNDNAEYCNLVSSPKHQELCNKILGCKEQDIYISDCVAQG